MEDLYTVNTYMMKAQAIVMCILYITFIRDRLLRKVNDLQVWVNWTVNNVRFCWTRPRSPIFHASSDILRATRRPEPGGSHEASAYMTHLSRCRFLTSTKYACRSLKNLSFSSLQDCFSSLIINRKFPELRDIHHSSEPRRIPKVRMVWLKEGFF